MTFTHYHYPNIIIDNKIKPIPRKIFYLNGDPNKMKLPDNDAPGIESKADFWIRYNLGF